MKDEFEYPKGENGPDLKDLFFNPEREGWLIKQVRALDLAKLGHFFLFAANLEPVFEFVLVPLRLKTRLVRVSVVIILFS